MAKINRGILREFVNEGFFDVQKTVDEVVKKLDTRGFKIEVSKKGLLAQLLTKLCQEGLLERTLDKKYKKR